MTKQYMTRDLYKGSWKDVLAKYEAMSDKNKNERPKFVQEGSILKNIDRIAEIVHKSVDNVEDGDSNTVKNDTHVNMVAPVKQNVASVKHYPVFEIVEVRTIRRACPTADDVIKWRDNVSDEEMDRHVVQISYQITQVTQSTAHVDEDVPPPRPTPIPVSDSHVTRETITTQIPQEITMKVDVSQAKNVIAQPTQNTRQSNKQSSTKTTSRKRAPRKIAPIIVA